MRKDFLGALVGLVFVAVLTTIGVDMYRQAKHRIELAESWSNDDFAISASGRLDRTLLVNPLTFGDKRPIACTLFIRGVVSDAQLSGSLVDAGFNQMECDGQFGDLHQNVR
jgi:hypothetical protein